MARLILNGGSSSWKCGAYDVAADAVAADASEALAEVRVSWGSSTNDMAELDVRALDGRRVKRTASVARGRAVVAALDALSDAGVAVTAVESVGHRIVHGANEFRETTWLDADVMKRLQTLAPFAPSHNPIELAAVAAVRERAPAVRQYAVFDTQFHHTLTPDAYVYPGPYAWLAKNVRRYGFHGSSVGYSVERAAAMLGRDPAHTNLIVAHLGSGCSVTAVRAGRSVDTSMGFTPLDGTMMSTRSGAIDPSIVIFLMRESVRTGGTTNIELFANDFERALNTGSGLLGISGVSGDLRDVVAASDAGNERAKLAIDLFVHRLATTIGGLLPTLDRVDAVVFTGGIGEHGARIRAAVCERLAFAGISIDASANAANALDSDVAPGAATVRTLVIGAREEWYIAREGARLVAGSR